MRQPSYRTVNLESLNSFFVKLDNLDNVPRRFFEVLFEKSAGKFAIRLMGSCLS